MSLHRPSIADKRRAFHRLHEQGCFVLPNPWDVGSAKYLQAIGFKALASTSSGFAWSHGHADNRMSRDRILEHLSELEESTDIPINADFESGFAPDAAGVGENVRLAVGTGVAGLSIEDSTGDAKQPLYDETTAVERVRAARKAIDATGGDTLLVGRCECFLVGQPDIELAVRRLKAYANAGADCLYAPGLVSEAHIRTVVDAVAPKPVNLLLGWHDIDLVKATALGVRRISIGGALARAAWGGFERAAKRMLEGRFDGFADAASGKELNALFAPKPGT